MKYLVLIGAIIFFLACSTKSPQQIAEGKVVYEKYCLSCHMQTGGGVPNLNPSLINSAIVNGDKNNLINVLLQGSEALKVYAGRKTYGNIMASWQHLTNKQIANVLTFVRNSFDNKATSVSENDVLKMRK